jgi:hypothetical protein
VTIVTGINDISAQPAHHYHALRVWIPMDALNRLQMANPMGVPRIVDQDPLALLMMNPPDFSSRSS